MGDHPYHHGALRKAALECAAAAIIEGGGVSALSLRDIGRRAGVSHAAFKHHFGSKPGLLTALATEGYEVLAKAVTDEGHDLVEAGVAYIQFAVAHPAHFEVMFRPGIVQADDSQLASARERASLAFTSALPEAASAATRLAAWSIVHGFATLWLSGGLHDDLGSDASVAARPVIMQFVRDSMT
jgi:AcrR family transcriptional regulator